MSALIADGSARAPSALASAATEGALAEGWSSPIRDDSSRELLAVWILGRELLELLERDLGLCARGPDQSQVGLVDRDARVAEETFVHVADLFHVDVAERDPTGFALDVGDLHRPQHVEHDPVRHGHGEGAVLGGGCEKRKAVGVEQRASVGGHSQVLERRSSVERLAGGEQPMPCERRCVERLFTGRALGDEPVELA